MKSLLQRNLLVNLLLMLLVTVALVLGLLTSLHNITKHGQDTKVPNVVGKKLAAAMKELQGFEIKIDSIYIPYKDPLEVIIQDPLPDNMVKTGRIVFLTVNKQSPPTIAMPALVNMSFRNAVLTLEGYRLIMGDTIFKPDIAAGAVLGQLFNGKPINSGTNIPVGSRIDLIVGAGLSDSMMPVPDLVGKSFAEVRSLLDASGILYNVVWDGSISDSNVAVIYNQQPESKNELDFINNITPGDMIDIRIMQRPSAELLRMNQAGSRKFLDPNDTNAVVTYGPATNELPHSMEGTDATGGSSTTAIPVKQKPRRPKTTKEEVNQILNSPDNKPDVPAEQAPKPDVIGPKPEDVPKPKSVDNKPLKNALGKEAKDAAIAKAAAAKAKQAKNGKDIKQDKNKPTDKKKPADKPKPDVPKKKKDPVKAKNNNDFSDEFK
jgi:eukaryotic-like serine/threonine-protein kinase